MSIYNPPIFLYSSWLGFIIQTFLLIHRYLARSSLIGECETLSGRSVLEIAQPDVVGSVTRAASRPVVSVY